MLPMKPVLSLLNLLVALMMPGLGSAEDLDLGAMVQPVPLDSKFADPDYYVWCGAPVKGLDGRYHLFYSRWPKTNPDKFAPGWAIVSEVAYAVADHPRGPYAHVNVALPPRGINPVTGTKYWDADMTHNPYIILKDGTYYLYYIGNFGDGTYAVHRNNDRIGVAWSTNPAGPWTRIDQPIIDITPDPAGSNAAFDSLCVANPAITVMPDGKMLVIYKGVKNSGSLMGGPVRYGAAIADTPTGNYVKQLSVAGQIFLPPGASSMEAEDPFIWFSTRYGNRYHAVARDVIGTFTGVSGGLALFQSDDGLNWEPAPHPKVLGSSFAWAGGTPSASKVERPFVLLENELPVALFGATDGYDIGGRLSFNVHIPLQVPPAVTIASPAVDAITLADTQTQLTLAADVMAGGGGGTPVIAWSQVSGPAQAVIEDPAATTTSAGFPADGVYTLECTATDSAGSVSDRVIVAVNTPLTLSFRQGSDAYAHTATMIRGDNPTWNGGARDQLLVGRWGGKGMRALFSFPLTSIPADAVVHAGSLDLWTAGVASTTTLGALELRALIGTPTEGTGDGQSSTAATTGATWNHRTEQPPGIAWNTPGGDLDSTVLAEVPGYMDIASYIHLAFGSSATMVAATQAAVLAGKPLDLALVSPLTESGATNMLTRIASDDHATLGLRPQLNVTFSGNFAPIVDPGSPPAAIRGVSVPLAGSATHADTVRWELSSGPGAVAFSDETSTTPEATFSQPGSYLLALTAANPLGETRRLLAIDIAPNPAFLADWQALTWPGISDPEIIGAQQDPDHDGLPNLLEWALHLDPKASDAFAPALQMGASVIEYTYTRRKASPGEVIFSLEWSDTLDDPWSAEGVISEPPVAVDETTESVRVTVPATGERSFVRLKIQTP